MKKLRKRNYLNYDTIEAFACNCTCGTCGGLDIRLDHRVDVKVGVLEK